MMSHDEDESGHHRGPVVHHEKIHNAHGHEGEEEEGEGPWLMSFADMVTLLMCFFILFFSTDKGNLTLQDPEELMKKLEAVQKMLGIQESESSTKDQVQVRTPTGAYGTIEAFSEEVKELSRQLDLVFSVGTPRPGELELTFLNTRFFGSGSATLTKQADLMLKGLSRKLEKLDARASIEVEGHTDSDPIRSDVYPSNWELSSARAATVVKLLQQEGINPSRLKASGMAHYQPIVPETDEAGQSIAANKALNRRVVIRVKHQLIAGESKQDAPKLPK